MTTVVKTRHHPVRPNPVVEMPDGSVALLVCGEHVRVDRADLPLVLSRRWTLSRRKDGKIYVRGSRDDAYMHRVLTGAPAGFHVDHRNLDGLDNRRCNIRVATSSQNGANSGSRGGSSRFKGVSRTKWGTWEAYIKVARRRINLGSYAAEEDAALAYDIAALEAWGSFARLNLPGADHDRHPIRLLPGRMAYQNRWRRHAAI